MPQYSVLLVEDSKVVEKLILRLLREVSSFEFEIQTARNLKNSLNLLETSRFDCVLLDLTLPDSAPEETFETVNQTIPDTPIIVTTGSSDNKLAQAAIQQGAQDFLSKSDLTQSVLSKSIIHGIERKKLILEAEEKEHVLYLRIEELENINEQLEKNLSQSQPTSEECQNNAQATSTSKIDRSQIESILLVDDCTINLTLTKYMLKNLEIKIETAANGQEAIDNFKAHHSSIIFMDINMPIMDGLTAMKKLRKDTKNDTVIIALSATDCKKMKETYHKSGFNDVLSKPINDKTLQKTLGKFIRL